jgi:hypothetical protein
MAANLGELEKRTFARASSSFGSDKSPQAKEMRGRAQDYSKVNNRAEQAATGIVCAWRGHGNC